MDGKGIYIKSGLAYNQEKLQRGGLYYDNHCGTACNFFCSEVMQLLELRQYFSDLFPFCTQVSLLFEVEDLAVASPATVSRCGMVFTDYKDVGWQPYVDCWLGRRQDKV